MAAKAMTKSQIVAALADACELSKKGAAGVLDTLCNLAVKECKRSGVFVLPGIGKLVKANRKARMGRNPQTGEPIKIPAKTVVKFRVAKACKTAIVGKK